MTEQEPRYDRIAEGYATWWSPVHRSATLRLLDLVAPDVEGGARQLLDVGCGTGALAAAAVTRWPEVVVDGIDASRGMLRVAERERDVLAPEAVRRIRLGHGYADRLPFDDDSFSVVLSAFVLQLVPSRFRALREMRRVLRPGGRLAYVTWLRGGPAFAADDAFDDALEAVGLEPRAWDGDAGDEPASAGSTAAQLRRAGFAEARAREDTLAHRFTPESYLGFVAQFDEEDRFASLAPDQRAALEAELLARLRALSHDDLELVLPIVYVSGRRPLGRGRGRC